MNVSFGKIVKMHDWQGNVDRKAALVADLANGNAKKYVGNPHKLIAREIRQIFDDVKPSDKATHADVLYLADDTYVVSGEDAKKIDRLRSRFYETGDNFYFSQMEKHVEKECEPFELKLKVGGNKKSSMQKINIVG